LRKNVNSLLKLFVVEENPIDRQGLVLQFGFYFFVLKVIGVPDSRLGEEVCAWIK